MNRDGSEHKVLTPTDRFATLGRLSPDGSRVLLCDPTPPPKGMPAQRNKLVVLDLETGKATTVEDVPLNGDIMGYCWSPDGKRISYTWREIREVKQEELGIVETESFLVVCDRDGKNPKTIASETVRVSGLSPSARWTGASPSPTK